MTPYSHRYKEGEFSVTWHRNGQLIEEEGHVTDLIAREALQWLEQRGSRPFLLYLPFTAIHVPMAEPERWLQANAHLVDPAQRLRAAAASHMDDAIGQVLSALDRKKVHDNTLVIFFGDNGAHGPSSNQGGPYPGDYGSLQVGNDNRPWRGYKGGLYEGGIRTPGLAYWPGKLTPRAAYVPCHVVDWMPTLCALAGTSPAVDPKWDGVNIWPVLTGEDEGSVPRPIYIAGVGFRSAALRYGDWKDIVNRAGTGGQAGVVGSEELFDPAADPGETKNLAGEMAEQLTAMRERLARASAGDGDAVAKD